MKEDLFVRGGAPVSPTYLAGMPQRNFSLSSKTPLFGNGFASNTSTDFFCKNSSTNEPVVINSSGDDFVPPMGEEGKDYILAPKITKQGASSPNSKQEDTHNTNDVAISQQGDIHYFDDEAISL